MKFGSPLTMAPLQPYVYPNQMDPLGDIAATGTNSASGTVTALNPYNALLIVSGQTVRMFCVQAQVDLGGLFMAGFAGVAGQAPNGVWEALVPMACKPGQGIKVQAAFNANISGGAFSVYGLTGPCPTNVRSDGRSFPIGSLQSDTVVNNSVSNLVPAFFPTGTRMLLQSLVVVSNFSGPGMAATLQTTIAGRAPCLLWRGTVSPGGQTDDIVFPGGLLCDTAVGLVLSASGGAGAYAAASVTYDLTY